MPCFLKVVMMMYVDTKQKNSALECIFNNPEIVIFLDANFFITPDRSKVGSKPISFSKYKEIWLDPLFKEFPNLALHEAVYDEVATDTIKAYIDQKHKAIPAKLKIYKDNMLTEPEQILMRTYIYKIAPHSLYIPDRDNSKDRGEVKSLSFMAVKGFLYFAAHDNLPIRLIEQAELLHTGLTNMHILKMYEVIYFLYKKEKYDNKALRMLYKYQYHLTKAEKLRNPEWGEFILQMDSLYGICS